MILRICLMLVMTASLTSTATAQSAAHPGQVDEYRAAASAYREAAAKAVSQPERLACFNRWAEYYDCLVAALGPARTSCTKPTGDPGCPGSAGAGDVRTPTGVRSPATALPQTTSQAVANSIVDALGVLAERFRLDGENRLNAFRAAQEEIAKRRQFYHENVSPDADRVFSGGASELRVYLDSGGRTELRNADGDTLLSAAALDGDYQAARLLVLAGADVNAQNADGETPLVQATTFGSTKVVLLLLTSGANPRHIALHGERTARSLATHRHFSDTSRLLSHFEKHDDAVSRALKSIAAPDEQTFRLTAAAEMGSIADIAAMNLSGAALDRRDEYGYTALHNAVLMCRQPVVEYLVTRGANIEVRTWFEQTPLMLAVRNFEAPCPLDTLDPGISTSMEQKQLNVRLSIIRILLERGADPGARDLNGDDPEKWLSSYLQKQRPNVRPALQSKWASVIAALASPRRPAISPAPATTIPAAATGAASSTVCQITNPLQPWDIAEADTRGIAERTGLRLAAVESEFGVVDRLALGIQVGSYVNSVAELARSKAELDVFPEHYRQKHDPTAILVDRAGCVLQTGDRIISVRGVPATRVHDTLQLLRSVPAGETIPLVISREGQMLQVNLIMP